MREIRLCDDTELNKIYQLCEDNGLGVEIQGFYNPNAVESDEPIKVFYEYKHALEDFKGGKSLHAPIGDLNLGSNNKVVRETTMRVFNYAYNIARELGCTEMVVHNGYVPNTLFHEIWLSNAKTFWEEFFSDKDESITIMIENQNEEDSEILKREIDLVDDPRLKVCFDIGHAHANSNMPVEEWIISLGDRIGYVHLHNNHGKISGRLSYLNDEHLGLDMGTIDIEQTLELLEICCPDAIWNVECRLEYIRKSVETLGELGYLPKVKTK